MPRGQEINEWFDANYYTDSTGVVERAEDARNACPDWFAEYVMDLRDQMGLRDWSLFIIIENLERENAAGYCQVTYGRRLATIKIDQATFEGGRAELRQTVVHELIHCHFAAVQWVFNGIGKQLNPNVFGAFQDSFTDRMECTVDDIAEAWARKFPLPEPPADEQEAA